MCAIKCEVAPGVVGSLWELMIGQSSAVDDSHSVLGGGTGILAFSNCGQQFVTLWPGHRGRHTPTGRHLNKLILFIDFFIFFFCAIKMLLNFKKFGIYNT